jgi:hypothetical protein
MKEKEIFCVQKISLKKFVVWNRHNENKTENRITSHTSLFQTICSHS